MTRKENGVTLIALVITIIVLLILAGISIAMLSGENGILSNASKAGVATQVATAKENVVLTMNELISDYYNQKYVENNGSVGTLGSYIDQNIATRLDTSLVTYDSATHTFTLIYDNTITTKLDVNNATIGTWTNSTK